MSAGFFRIEGYGLEARYQTGKKARPWRTIEGVASEAARKVGAASHVKGQVAVELLLGEDPMTVAEVAADQARRARNQGKVKPGRLSPTASSIFGAIASYPESSRERAEDDSFIERYSAWRERLLTWIQKRWGQFRISVVEHRDEEFWHVHILIVPPVDEDRRLLVGLVHPGYAARGDLERAGHDSALANAAYKEAMRALLDEYQAEVGAFSGHVRKGDKPRQRLSRKQVLIDRQQREREVDLRERERDLIVTSDRLQRREASLEAEIDLLNVAASALAGERDSLESQRRQLEKEVRAFKGSSASERAQHEATWARQRSKLAKASALVAAASARNAAEHERLVKVRRSAMAADSVCLAAENQRMRADLAEAQRRLATLEAKLEAEDLSTPRRQRAL